MNIYTKAYIRICEDQPANHRIFSHETFLEFPRRPEILPPADPVPEAPLLTRDARQEDSLLIGYPLSETRRMFLCRPFSLFFIHFPKLLVKVNNLSD